MSAGFAPWRQVAGVLGAPAAWMLSTQAGQILPYVDCAQRRPFLLLTAALACLVGVGAASLSLIGVRHLAHTQRFIAMMSGTVGLALSFALLLQALATTMLDPCGR